MYWVLDGALRRACVRVRVQSACAFTRVLICMLVFTCVRARVSVRVCMPKWVCLCISIGLSLGALRPRSRGCVRGHRPGSHASAAGISWMSSTAYAEWAARSAHTSVIDAAGAIYVIGGGSRTTGSHGHSITISYHQDVWASTDGGAWPDSVKAWSVGYSRGYSRGYSWEYSRVPWGNKG